MALSFNLNSEIVRPTITAGDVKDANLYAKFDGSTLVPINLSVDILLDGIVKNITITGAELAGAVSIVVTPTKLKEALAAHIDSSGNLI